MTTITPLDVRRLAAVDMHGLTGTRLRRRVIVAEFWLGALACASLGIALIIATSTPLELVLGGWLIGLGANYVPLALYATAFSRGHALRDELAGADLRTELRYYTRTQLWVLVPGALVAFVVARPARPTDRPPG
jgi:hypothetical protein